MPDDFSFTVGTSTITQETNLRELPDSVIDALAPEEVKLLTDEQLQEYSAWLGRMLKQRLMTKPAYTRDQLVELGLDPEDESNEGVLIKFEFEGKVQYPTFQFKISDDGTSIQTIPVVAEINVMLDAKDDPWGVGDWWLSGNAYVPVGGDRTPAGRIGKVPDEDLVLIATVDCVC